MAECPDFLAGPLRSTAKRRVQAMILGRFGPEWAVPGLPRCCRATSESSCGTAMRAASLTKGYGGNPPSGRSVSPPRTGPFFLPAFGRPVRGPDLGGGATAVPLRPATDSGAQVPRWSLVGAGGRRWNREGPRSDEGHTFISPEDRTTPPSAPSRRPACPYTTPAPPYGRPEGVVVFCAECPDRSGGGAGKAPERNAPREGRHRTAVGWRPRGPHCARAHGAARRMSARPRGTRRTPSARRG